MKSFQKTLYVLAASVLICAGTAMAASPVIFFSDLTSGPATGGENGAGAFVTLYGNNFPASPLLTVGGVPAIVKLAPSSYLWYQKMTIQLPASAPSGATVIQMSGTSNTVPFTVRPGHIYFAGSNSGDQAGIVACKNVMVAGDTCYVRNGVSQTSVDNYTANLSIQSAGTAASPIALVAYPGATATIGTTSSSMAIRTPAVSGTKDYWIIAGFTLRASDALDLVAVTGWRVVGNDFSCPNGAGQTACMHTDTTTNYSFYGNNVHNVGDAAGSIDKYYHAVYFTTNSNHIDAGWNLVDNNPNGSTSSGGCRGIQFYSTGGSNQFDLHVHDNTIRNTICDGINFSTVDPSKGAVEAYNNLVYHVGTGPDPYNSASNYSCVVAGGGGSGSGSVQVYNNTFYDCGSRKTSDAGVLDPTGPSITARNNIVYQLSGESYLNPNASPSSLSGPNNLWFGLGNGPSTTTGNINSDPKIVSTSLSDFHLQASSPAIGAGLVIGAMGITSGLSIGTAAFDHDGVARPLTVASDLGAFQFGAGAVSNPKPAPPTNLRLTVQ